MSEQVCYCRLLRLMKNIHKMINGELRRTYWGFARSVVKCSVVCDYSQRCSMYSRWHWMLSKQQQGKKEVTLQCAEWIVMFIQSKTACTLSCTLSCKMLQCCTVLQCIQISLYGNELSLISANCFTVNFALEKIKGDSYRTLSTWYWICNHHSPVDRVIADWIVFYQCVKIAHNTGCLWFSTSSERTQMKRN